MSEEEDRDTEEWEAVESETGSSAPEIAGAMSEETSEEDDWDVLGLGPDRSEDEEIDEEALRELLTDSKPTPEKAGGCGVIAAVLIIAMVALLWSPALARILTR